VCFSPEIDIAAAVVVGAIGVDTIRRVHDKKDWPLAVLPALFAVHFAIEAFVWWGLDDIVSYDTLRIATWLYLFIALAVVPILVPWALALSEPPHPVRGTLLVALSVIGTFVGVVLFVTLLRQPYTADINNHCVEYDIGVSQGIPLAVLYVIATCGALLASSYRRLAVFGIVNLFVVILLAWVAASAFISLWCAWAAVTSVIINLHLRDKTRRRESDLVIHPHHHQR
jgi:hypothetical protein